MGRFVAGFARGTRSAGIATVGGTRGGSDVEKSPDSRSTPVSVHGCVAGMVKE